MTLSPCASLENKLNRAKVGLWPEHLVGKKEVVLAAKAPTTVIKAVYRGVDSLITISVIEVEQANIMCVGLQVQDEIENPFTVFQPFVTAQEHVLIEKLLSYSNFELHFFDENSRGLLATTCSFDYSLAKKAIEEVTRIRLYCLDHHRMSEFNTDFVNSILHKVNLALDIFQKDINSPMNGNPTMAIVKHIIPLSLTVLSPVPTYECGKGRFTLDETDEGRGLERTIYRLLENIYHDNTFLSPQVKEGVSQRELIDLLGFDSDSKTICLVESKVMSVLITEMSRTSKRRITSVEKQIHKALRQLQGAIMRIRSGNEIRDEKGQIINIPARDISIIHAVVVISELYPFVDWEKIADELAEISEQDRYRALFYVIDLQELQLCISHGNQPEAFSSVLLQCWLEVKTKKTNYIRGIAPVDSFR